MKTSNPILSEKAFTETVAAYEKTMTISGTVNKCFILLLMVLITAFYTWNLFYTTHSAAAVMPLASGGAITGFITAITIMFKKEWAPFLAPVYALFEGLVIGAVSAVFEFKYPGIAIQATGLTFAVLGGILLAYKSGLVRATESFRLGVVGATMGIALIYLATIIMGFFGVHNFSIFESGWIGIGFSLFVVIIAALNFVLDFDFIEKGSRNNLPAYMEWYAAFGLMITLVWLYLEILRLLAKLNSRK